MDRLGDDLDPATSERAEQVSDVVDAHRELSAIQNRCRGTDDPTCRRKIPAELVRGSASWSTRVELWNSSPRGAMVRMLGMDVHPFESCFQRLVQLPFPSQLLLLRESGFQ